LRFFATILLFQRPLSRDTSKEKKHARDKQNDARDAIYHHIKRDTKKPRVAFQKEKKEEKKKTLSVVCR